VGLVAVVAEQSASFITGAGTTVAVDLDELPVVGRNIKATRPADWPGSLTSVAFVANPEE
jgi:hypothetical protein